MALMFVTFAVLRELKFKVFNDVQPESMPAMLFTLEVLRGLKSREVNDLQP